LGPGKRAYIRSEDKYSTWEVRQEGNEVEKRDSEGKMQSRRDDDEGGWGRY
jgi:hypothetical protein